MRALLILLAAVCAGGCSLVGGIEAVDEHIYRIPAGSPVEVAGERRKGVQLVVKDTHADVFVNSQKIIFSSDGIEQGYYQFASWAESPPKRFSTLLVLALEQSGLFDSVTSIGAGALGNYQLNTSMLECYHDTSTKPGAARVRIRAELVEAVSRKFVEQSLFESRVELKSYDARGAVDAITEALQKAIGDIVRWLDQQDYSAVKTQTDVVVTPSQSQ